MKRFLAVICVLILLLVSACRSNRQSVSTYMMSVTTAVAFLPDTLDKVQIDSLTVADGLPRFSKWREMPFTDAESSTTIKYKVLVNPETNIVYTVKQLKDSRYVLFKKQLETIK